MYRKIIARTLKRQVVSSVLMASRRSRQAFDPLLEYSPVPASMSLLTSFWAKYSRRLASDSDDYEDNQRTKSVIQTGTSNYIPTTVGGACASFTKALFPAWST
ncbi:hypothetical protein SprV_0301345900 [Sparganum proliferum]